jgi:hypothetical protein
MFEVLRAIKADTGLSSIPFICVRLVGSNLAPTIVQSLEISCALLGAVQFIDLYVLEKKFGSHRAEAELGRMILASGRKEPRSIDSIP